MDGRSHSRYSTLIDEALLPLIPPGAPVAIFDFPNYANVGDSAIWLGLRSFLRHNGISRRVVFVADIGLTHAAGFPKLPEDCVILIQGGGNFGDLWPHHQRHREDIAARYPTNRIIQLPQSIHYQSNGGLQRTCDALQPHPDFHLLVRDIVSLEVARKIRPGSAHLCPDMALYLAEYPRPAAPQHAVVALLRTDHERKSDEGALSKDRDVRVEDWRTEPASLITTIDRTLATLHGRYPRKCPAFQPLHRPIFNRLATDRVRRGSRLLASGRVVITDRLHAHILCCLMGIPHVVLDNSYGKISNLRTTWNTGSHLCRNATDLSEAMYRARQLAGEEGHVTPSRPGVVEQ
ncbi:polysaccharide polymerase [Azoarcus olearius]|uniref:polysaccharide pyruvyl transferase family protein n=1 Tax=Azoarcus sp. (strain BH72) TaxID=418699 RepID=UPI00080613F5|nr:polysaccharide polymerase [Azoarcus olearius]